VASLNKTDLSPLTSKHESAVLQRLSEFPEAVEIAGQELAPHMIANYLKDLASDLHSYYNAEQFLVDDEKLKLARLALISATRQVLKNGLQLLGLTAPESM
jgi:arginyl-tRNA synthetase